MSGSTLCYDSTWLPDGVPAVDDGWSAWRGHTKFTFRFAYLQLTGPAVTPRTNSSCPTTVT